MAEIERCDCQPFGVADVRPGKSSGCCMFCGKRLPLDIDPSADLKAEAGGIPVRPKTYTMGIDWGFKNKTVDPEAERKAQEFIGKRMEQHLKIRNAFFFGDYSGFRSVRMAYDEAFDTITNPADYGDIIEGTATPVHREDDRPALPEPKQEDDSSED